MQSFVVPVLTVLVKAFWLLVAESTQVSSKEEGLMERKWTSCAAGAMLTFLELGTGVLMGIGATGITLWMPQAVYKSFYYF